MYIQIAPLSFTFMSEISNKESTLSLASGISL